MTMRVYDNELGASKRSLHDTTKPISVVTRDTIRKLRPHILNKEGETISTQKVQPTVLSITEVEKIQNASVFLTPDQIEQHQHHVSQLKEQAASAALSRKEKMEAYDLSRSHNAPLSELEKEMKDKSKYLLAKAQLQLDEQDDEIKHLNELMLYAKCVSIRDIQVEEKKLIANQKKEEEKRLDLIMERDRIADLKRLEEREKSRILELRKGADMIRKQIEERREAAMLEQERKDQETKLILKTIADNLEREKTEKNKKKASQKGLMQDVVKANVESLELKKQQRAKDEEEDRKVIQYILEKEKAQAEKEKANLVKKAEREKELARLLLAQEKLTDKHSQQDALRAQRAFEAYEREWRKKEKEAAEKQVKLEQELSSERIKQQRAREYAIAVEAYRLKKDFFENLERQKQDDLKVKNEVLERKEANHVYSVQVQAQIREKEAVRRKERQEFFAEGQRIMNEEAEKKKKVDAIKQRKLAELKSHGVPPKYCVEVERQVYTTVKNTFSNAAHH